MTASDITTDVSIFEVTARAEHIPSTPRAIGLLFKMGSNNILLYFPIKPSSPEFLYKHRKSILAEPESYQIIHTIGGQS